jgi:hypothetical protein
MSDLPVPAPAPSAITEVAAPSPPALVRPSAALVGAAGGLAAAPLALITGAVAAGVLQTYLPEGLRWFVTTLCPAIPWGDGVLTPYLFAGLGEALRFVILGAFDMVGPGAALLAADALRRRLQPWNPDAARGFEASQRGVALVGAGLMFSSGWSASSAALLVVMALWSARPAPRPGETPRALAVAAGAGTVCAFGVSLGGALWRVLGPSALPADAVPMIQDLGSVAQLHAYWLRNLQGSAPEIFARFFGIGLFLMPITILLARATRRALPREPRLAVATVAALPALLYGGTALASCGFFGAESWGIIYLRQISATAPVAQIQRWIALAWIGGVVLPQVAAAALGAGHVTGRSCAFPQGAEIPRLPAEGRPTAPAGFEEAA